MMKGFLVYKCRQCGDLAFEEKEYRDSTVKIGHQAYSILVNTEKDAFTKHHSHKCRSYVDDGIEVDVFGICDLVGVQLRGGQLNDSTEGGAE